MFLNSQPQHTKQTRTNNNLPNTFNTDNFLRPSSSQISEPIMYNHDSYMLDHNARVMHSIDIERNFSNSRNNDRKNSINHDREINCVQSSFQNDYYTQNFNINKSDDNNINLNDEHGGNIYLTRNPVNTRRDQIEKSRNVERQDFLKKQGGMLNNFADLSLQNTRKDKNTINSSCYVPMPKTLAIPKENL
jgi:hypothetical protein